MSCFCCHSRKRYYSKIRKFLHHRTQAIWNRLFYAQPASLLVLRIQYTGHVVIFNGIIYRVHECHAQNTAQIAFQIIIDTFACFMFAQSISYCFIKPRDMPWPNPPFVVLFAQPFPCHPVCHYEEQTTDVVRVFGCTTRHVFSNTLLH